MSDDPKRSPSEAWQALEKGALRDEGERVAKLGDAELDASLAGRGVDPEAARKRGAELAAKLMAQRAGASAASASASAPAPAPAQPPKVVSLSSARAKRARPVALTWLIAAAATAAVLGGGGAAYVALRTPEPTPTTPPVPTTPPGPSPEMLAQQEADTLRTTAATECAASHWAPCLASLRRAGQLDPAGAAAQPIARMQGKATRALVQQEIDAKGGRMEPRSLSSELAAAFTEAMAKHRGQAVSLACAPGAEPQGLCGALTTALKKAGWVVTRPHGKAAPATGGTVAHGTRVQVALDADDATQGAADALADALQGALLRTAGPDDAPAGSVPTLTLVVGPQ